EEIFLDLNALYINIDQLAKGSQQQGIVLNSEYQKSRAAILKLITDARVFALRKKFPDFNDIKVIDFNSSRNTSKQVPPAEINPSTRLLELRPLTSSRAHLVDRGSRVTRVYTKTYSTGIKGTLSNNFPPIKMVDQRPQTFWGTLIMADSPVSQIYERATRTGDTYQIGVDGPVTEIFFRFSHAEKINRVRMLPFAEYPVKIIDVSYRPSASAQIFYPIKDFNSVSTLDWEELNFDSIFAHEIRITIAQENYKRVTYHLPKRVVVNTDLFQHIFRLRAQKVVGNAIFDSDVELELARVVSLFTSAVESLEEIMTLSEADISFQTDIDYLDSFEKLLSEIYSDVDPEIRQRLLERLTNTELFQQEDQDELIEVNKYEYILGMREVELDYVLFSPTSYYESERFETQATISQLQLEIEDRHTEFTTPWETGYRKTSVEWDFDIGDGRVVPIHPINQVDDFDLIPTVKDERLFFDRRDGIGRTRLGSYYAVPYRLKKEGQLIPETEYESVKITGSVPKLQVTLTGDWFDEDGIYTIDYAVDPTSYNIDVLDKFNSRLLDTPELFTETGPDNDITLSKFPYINYEVINLTGVFEKSTGDSRWTFVPSQANQATGHVVLTPTIVDSVGNVLQTGGISGATFTGRWGDRSGHSPLTLAGNGDLDTAFFGSINGVSYGYFMQIMDSSQFVELDQFVDTTGFVMKNPFEATVTQLKRWDTFATGGFVFSGQLTGSPVSGDLRAEFVLGIGVKTDDQTFALRDTNYEPLTVKIGGREATNITNYETLVHPAFSVANRRDTEFEYIHAGKKIFFNQPVVGQEVRVQYRWITEYVKLLGTLRCNTKINPDLTPKVNSATILVNHLVI
ncbi:MAG: hypothetical protein ACXABY_22355, partial [Candidatus Thorarchaeota archaeon]